MVGLGDIALWGQASRQMAKVLNYKHEFEFMSRGVPAGRLSP